MRVSKDVRNFIGEQVREIFAKSEVEKGLEVELKTKREKAEEIISTYNENIKTFLQENKDNLNKELENIGFEAYLTSKWNSDSGFDCSVNYFNFNTSQSETYKKQRELETQRQERIAKSIQDIIITLELGGNKQDLMNMLEKLKEDNK